jgi:hypothetical protein
MQRPFTITIIGWLSIFGVLALWYFVYGAEKSPLFHGALDVAFTDAQFSIGIQKMIFWASCLIVTVCGFGIMQARNWARWLYLAWLLTLLLVCALTLTSAGVSAILLATLAIGYFLFIDHEAAEWFT